MGSSILLAGTLQKFVYKEYRDGVFVLNMDEHDGGGEIEIVSPLELNDAFKDMEFDVYYLVKKDVNENDIFKVVDSKDSRIGWCIPVNALGSDLHDYSADEHFLKYAYKAMEKTLSDFGDGIFKADANYSTDGQINFSDILHPFTVLLVVSRSNIKERGALFDFEKSLPSLVKFGYQPLTSKNPSLVQHTGISPEGRQIKLRMVSSDIDNYNVIVSILTSVLAYEGNPVFRFFYIYQIFELLIESILKLEQEEVIEELYLAKYDPVRSREILKELKEIIGEKERIKLLVDKYSRCGDSLDDLRNVCREFLNSVGVKSGTNFEDYFYPVRNFMVHRLRELPEINYKLLSDIVLHTIEFLPRILSEFKPVKP